MGHEGFETTLKYVERDPATHRQAIDQIADFGFSDKDRSWQVGASGSTGSRIVSPSAFNYCSLMESQFPTVVLSHPQRASVPNLQLLVLHLADIGDQHDVRAYLVELEFS